MKLKADPRLFWFFKEGTSLDLNNRPDLEQYVQQVITCGSEKDIRSLLHTVPLAKVKEIFPNIKRFLPPEVRNFWEDFLASY